MVFFFGCSYAGENGTVGPSHLILIGDCFLQIEYNPGGSVWRLWTKLRGLGFSLLIYTNTEVQALWFDFQWHAL